ncbi:MAG: hypothetical protein QM742_16955 [Aquabacterium sp.]
MRSMAMPGMRVIGVMVVVRAVFTLHYRAVRHHVRSRRRVCLRRTLVLMVGTDEGTMGCMIVMFGV